MKLTWPEVTDIKHPRYTNSRYLCPYCTLRFSKSLDLWCAFDRLSNFEKKQLEVGSLNVVWRRDLWGQGSTFSAMSQSVPWIAMQNFRHEKAWTANQNQQDRLPRKDGTGANDCGRAAAHPRPPPPPSPPNRLWYLSYLGIRSPVAAATASMSGCPATANIFDGTAWSLLLTDRGRLHSFI